LFYAIVSENTRAQDILSAIKENTRAQDILSAIKTKMVK